MDMPKIEYPTSDHSSDLGQEMVKDMQILEESDGNESQELELMKEELLSADSQNNSQK